MNSSGPIISVVLTSCNQLNLLKFSLMALRDQAPDIAHEVIVVDSGSNDDTGQFLASQAEAGSLRAIFAQADQGRSAARNKGAHAAKGRYIMFLDPGIIVGPGWWEAMTRTLDMDPQVAASAGKIILPDGRIDHAGLALLEWWDESSDSGVVTQYGARLTARSILAGRPAEEPASNRPMTVQALSGDAIMVRAEAFFSVGGFSTRLGRDHHQVKSDFVGEISGVDLCLRLNSRGWQLIYRFESVMTRLRLGQANITALQNQEQDRQQVIFNKTWLGRVRGDFRIKPGEGAVPGDDESIQRYIEPVISFDTRGKTAQARPQGASARGMSSVVVVTHNNLTETRKCATALLDHTDSRHEIIFIDTGSTDGTTEYLQELSVDNRHCRLVTLPVHPGFAAAHNRGLAEATGQYVVLLASDAVVTPQWLEILSTTADQHSRVGLIGPVTNQHIGQQHVSGLDYDPGSLRGLNSFAALVSESQAGHTHKTMRLSGFCMLVKRELMARIGGLDEQFQLGNYEDNDYCLRAQLAGYESLVAEGCFVHQSGQPDLTPEQITRLDEIRGQWEIFKTKWGIPASMDLNEPMDMAALLSGGFQPQRHFHPLPLEVTGEESKVKQKVEQEAFA